MKTLKKALRYFFIFSFLLLAASSVTHAQIDSGSEIFEKAFDEVSSWKDWIDKLLYVVAAIVLMAGVVQIVIKVLTKEQGQQVEIGSEIGRWLLIAAFIAAAGVITSLFVV